MGRDPQGPCGKGPVRSGMERSLWAWGLGSDLVEIGCGQPCVNVGRESTARAPNSSSAKWEHSSHRVLERNDETTNIKHLEQYLAQGKQ